MNRWPQYRLLIIGAPNKTLERGGCPIEDQELVMLLQKGDLTAFDELFAKYQHMAVRTAYLITGNRAICEDIVQETFINCYRNIGKLKNPQGFRAWFYRILTRAAWRYGKAAGREIPTANIWEEADKTDTDNSPGADLQADMSRLLYTEITRLQPKLKTVVVLYYFNGLTTKEIAKAVGCLDGTVKSRLYTARQNLKKSMEAQGYLRKEPDNNEIYRPAGRKNQENIIG